MRAPKTWKGWTQRELDRLEELRLEGLTAAAIAAALGRSEASVKCRLREEKITRPHPRLALWLAVLDRPHTMRGAASSLGVRYGTVKAIKLKLRRLGYDIPAATRATGHQEDYREQ